MEIRLTQVSGLARTDMEAVMGAIGETWLPTIAARPGFMGYSVFGNADTGTGGLSTAWATTETLLASAEDEQGLTDAAVAAANYNQTLVTDTYELLSWGIPPKEEMGYKPVHLRLGLVSELELADMESVRLAIDGAWLPEVSQLPGFLGYSVFGNRDEGKGGMSTLWSQRWLSNKTAKAEERVYNSAAEAAGQRGQRSVRRYDLLDWRVPTMAEAAALSG